MTRTSLSQHNCSLARASDILGDKWVLLILRDAFYGQRSFAAFKKRLGVTQSVLSQRLAMLCEHELLRREQASQDVERYDYRLTDKGQALFPVLVALTQWGDEWMSGPGCEPVLIVEKANGRPVAKIQVQNRLGESLTVRDVAFAPGPGANEETLAQFAMARRKSGA